MIIDPAQPAAAAATQGIIKDGDTRSFNSDVIAASMKVPVIVDFWATWCGPCKTLGPLLEKLVRQAAGRVRLVKIDIDKNPDLAAQLRVQSVPMVYAFAGGRPVDAFVGAQPESKLRAFIDRLTQGADAPLDDALALAQELLAEGEFAQAAELFGRVLQQDPGHPKALAGAIRARLLAGDLKGARAQAKGVPPDLATNPDVAPAVAAISLYEECRAAAGDVGTLRSRVQRDPADHAARLDLARAMFGKGLAEGAVDELLTSIRADRKWQDEAARKLLIRVFDGLGPAHPVTVAGRRRLSSILFS